MRRVIHHGEIEVCRCLERAIVLAAEEILALSDHRPQATIGGQARQYVDRLLIIMVDRDHEDRAGQNHVPQRLFDGVEEEFGTAARTEIDGQRQSVTFTPLSD